MGLIGFFLTLLPIALFVPSLFALPNLVTVLVILGAFSYGVVGLYRDRILGRIARKGFVSTFRVQRELRWLF